MAPFHGEGGSREGEREERFTIAVKDKEGRNKTDAISRERPVLLLVVGDVAVVVMVVRVVAAVVVVVAAPSHGRRSEAKMLLDGRGDRRHHRRAGRALMREKKISTHFTGFLTHPFHYPAGSNGLCGAGVA